MGFVKVAEAAEVKPGVGRAVRVGGRDLALFLVEGAFYCIDNDCPHRNGPLADGFMEGDTVICPWHAWQVSVKTGEVLYMGGLCVNTYPCKVEDGSIFVEI